LAQHRYLIALGSNMRHVRHGSPSSVLRAAFGHLDGRRIKLETPSPIFATAPLGPSCRRYANAAAIVATRLEPARLLAQLKQIEAEFGRRPGGMRWRARVLDLDIILWSGGAYTSPALTIPHRLFRTRSFVLRPSLCIAGHWRDPMSGLTIRHLSARLTQRRPPLRAHRSRTTKRLGGP
jgi:2-amino-4-hydroxy-6-hydroxymethyldihydropteridine diphosphokinase